MLIALAPSLLVGAQIAGAEGAEPQPDSTDLRAQEQQVREQQGAAEAAAGEIAAALAEAVAARDAVQADLVAATARVHELEAQTAVVRDQQAALAAEVERLTDDIAVARGSLARQVRTAYISGGAGEQFAMLLDADAVADVGRRTHYLQALSRSDRAVMETLANDRTLLDRRLDDLAAVEHELQALQADAAEAQAELDHQFALAAEAAAEVAEQLAAAQAEADRLTAEAERLARAAEEAEQREAAEREAARRAAEEAERRAREAEEAAAAAAAAANPGSSDGGGSDGGGSDGGASDGGGSGDGGSGGGGGSAPVASGGMVCPQDRPYSYMDTWGAPRPGGRRHKGTDIFGARGGNVFAITNGVIGYTRTGGTAGLYLSLLGDDGHTYLYMHLQDFVASAGQRVTAGQLIAHNGDTGNARGTHPHIHFEYHPGGGGPVNPYPLIASVCP